MPPTFSSFHHPVREVKRSERSVPAARSKAAYSSQTEPIRREQPIAPCDPITWGDACPDELAAIDAPWAVCAGRAVRFPSASTGIGESCGGSSF